MSIEIASLTQAFEWVNDGRSLAMATLVETEGSSPFEVGATMLIDADQNIEGSITGGCVEGALVDEAIAVFRGEPPRVRAYGISDELAGGAGLMCGGTVHVFIERINGGARRVLERVLAAALEGKPAAVATLLDGESAGARLAVIGGEPVGTLGRESLDLTLLPEIRCLLDQGVTGLRRYGADGALTGSALRVAVRSFTEPPRMVIVGAVDFSVAMAVLAKNLGYRVSIVDPREPFVRSSRFAEAAETVVDWPDRYLQRQCLSDRDAVLVFTHDPKLDQPALFAALNSGAGYVGALGSRRAHDARVRRLFEAGMSRNKIGRIAAPCGLDIGARTPAETAVSILCEVIATRNSRSSKSLSETHGPIHPRSAAEAPASSSAETVDSHSPDQGVARHGYGDRVGVR